MKKLTFFSSLLVVLMFVSVSCSKDDKPAPGQEQASFDIVFNGINVNANYQNVTPPSQTKQMADVLSSANKSNAPYVKSGKVEYSDSYISLQGLNAGESLSNVSINLMNGTSTSSTYSLGKVTANPDGSTIKVSTNDCMTFLNTVTNSLATSKNKSVTLQVVINGGDTDVSNLNITIHALATFSW